MKNISEILENVKTVGIGGHIRPDGDCIGSCLGLYTYIVEQYPEKEVTLFLEPVQDKFSFLKYAFNSSGNST